MKANSFRASPFRHSAQRPTAGSDRADQLARLYTDLSTARRRLSIVVAEYRSVRPGTLMQPGVARARLAHAVLVDGCTALDRVAELPALARQHTRPVPRRASVGLVAQADAMASVAVHLAGVLRGQATGFRGDLVALPGFGGLAGFSGLDPNETDTSLFLAAENVSLALSLAARLALVLARLHARRDRVRRVAMLRVRLAARVARWAVCVASLPLSTDLAHARPTAPTHPTAVAVAATLAVTVMAVDRQPWLRFVGPAGAVRAVVDLLGDLAGVAVSVALPHLVLPVVALVDVVTGTRAADGRLRPAQHEAPGCVATRDPRRRRARREPQDQ